jgi:hypothetical protein
VTLPAAFGCGIVFSKKFRSLLHLHSTLSKTNPSSKTTLQLHLNLFRSTMNDSDPSREQHNQNEAGSSEGQHATSVADTIGSLDTTSGHGPGQAQHDTITESYDAQYETTEAFSNPLDNQNARPDQAKHTASTPERVGEASSAYSSFKLLDARASVYGEVLPSHIPASTNIVFPQRSSRTLPTSPYVEVDINESTVSQSTTSPTHAQVDPIHSTAPQESAPPTNADFHFDDWTASHGSDPSTSTLRPTRTVFQDAELQNLDPHKKSFGFRVDHSVPLQYDGSGAVVYDRSLPYSYGNEQHDRGPQAYAQMNGGLQPDIWTDWYCQGSAFMPECRTKNLLPFPPRNYIPHCWRCMSGSIFKKASTERKVPFRAR